MLTFLISVLIPICLVLVFRFINRPHKPPLFGIYQQKTKYYWLKFVLLFAVLTVRQWLWRMRRAYAVEAGKSGDGTIQVHTEDAALDQKHDLDTHAEDACFFNGISEDGNTAVLFSLAVKQEYDTRANVCDAQAIIKVNGEVYLSPSQPDTYLRQDEKDRGEFRVQSIQLENFIPMRTWKLAYNGQMKLKSDSVKTAEVQAELTWSALFPPFNYEYQLSPWIVARDVAREPWSRYFFNFIGRYRLSHYEQMGSLKGIVKVDGKEYAVEMPCFRGRTFGKALNWANFHRYVFHTLYLENGDCIAVGCVSQPLLISHMTVGFVCRKSDQATLAVQSSDFKLYQHGENRVPPEDYGFTFIAGGQRYTVEVIVDEECVSYIGERREAKLHERWLTVRVNGVAGRGCARWQYKNVV